MRPRVFFNKRVRRQLQFQTLESREVFAAGDIDQSFGDSGKVLTEFSDSASWGLTALDVAVQSDQRIVAAGEGSLVRYLADGSIDTSFGPDGRVAVPFYARSVAIQNDGRILVAGATDPSFSQDFVIARFTTNGVLDTTWNNTGIVSVDFGSTNERANTVEIDAEDRILVAGYSDTSLAVARLLPNGSLDTGFSSDGKFSRQVHRSDVATSIAFQSNGQIVIGGTSWIDFSFNNINYDMFAMRLNSNGAVDTTFGDRGMATVGFIPSVYSNDEGLGVAIDSENRIILAGQAYGNFRTFAAIARLTSQGVLDTSFNNGEGKRIDPIADGTAIGSLAQQSDGKLLLSSTSTLYRYDTTGALDVSFDSDGAVVPRGQIRSLAINDNGDIIAAGRFRTGFGVARLTDSGAIDTSFSVDGIVTTATGPSQDIASASVRQSDGKTVVVGRSQNGFAVARYEVNGQLDTTFSGDGLNVIRVPIENSEAIVKSVAIASDGKILIFGSLVTVIDFSGVSDLAVVRLNADGSIDTTFSDDGILIIDRGGFEQGTSLLPLSGGKFLIAGQSNNGQPFVSQYLSTGEIDRSFSGDGTTPIAIQEALINSMVLQPDGKIVLAGTKLTSVGRTPSFVFIARLLADGSMDTDFGNGGRFIDTANFQNTGNSVALQTDGSILVAGETVEISDGVANTDMAVSRYAFNGSPDNLFRTRRIVFDERASYSAFLTGRLNSTGNSVLVDPAGKIVIAGSAGNNMAVVRLNADGTPDSSFAADGRLVESFGQGKTSAASAVVQSNNRLVVSGSFRSNYFNSFDSDFALLGIDTRPRRANSTTISQAANGTISITDAWGRDDRWSIARTATDIVITDHSLDSSAKFRIVGIPSASGDGTKQVTIPLSSITASNRFVFNGLGGDDQLNIIGDQTLPSSVIFRGGLGNDELMQTAFRTALTWTLTSADTGTSKAAGALTNQFASVESFVGGQQEDNFKLTYQPSNTSLKIDGVGSTSNRLYVNGDVDISFTERIIPSFGHRLLMQKGISNAAQVVSLRGLTHAFLTGGTSANLLDASKFPGPARILGGESDDTIIGSRYADVLLGGDGNDQIYAGDGDDTLRGEAGDDLLLGESGKDIIQGGQGRDIVIGGYESDRLDGGADQDILIGGNGIQFVFTNDSVIRQALLQAWRADESYEDRIRKLAIEGIGATNAIKLQIGTSVFNDNDVDTIFGREDLDWYFVSDQGTSNEIGLASGGLRDAQPFETVTSN